MENKKHVCKTCKKILVRKEWPEKHIIRGCHHTTCKVCSKKIVSVSKLQQHKNVHKPFVSKRVCGVCGRKFDLVKYLKNHAKNANHTPCDTCNKMFCYQSEMERHKRTEHIGGNLDTNEIEFVHDSASQKVKAIRKNFEIIGVKFVTVWRQESTLWK